jgi:hypothetical protein
VNPLTESRQALVAVLEPLGVTIYGSPPESVTPPAAVILPSPGEWYVPATYGSFAVHWQVTLMATMQGANAAALERLEALLWDADLALKAVGVTGHPSSPRILKIGTAEVAATDLPVQVYVTTTEGS